MVKGDIYTQGIKVDDPYFLQKDSLVSSNNYLHEVHRQDKGKLYNLFFFSISLTFTFASYFIVQYLGFYSVLILANTLVILLIVYVYYMYNPGKSKFLANRNVHKKAFKSFGLEWRD